MHLSPCLKGLSQLYRLVAVTFCRSGPAVAIEADQFTEAGQFTEPPLFAGAVLFIVGERWSEGEQW